MPLYIPRSIFHLVRLLYFWPENFGLAFFYYLRLILHSFDWLVVFHLELLPAIHLIGF